MNLSSTWMRKKRWIASIMLLSGGCGDGAQFGGLGQSTQSANVTRNAPPPESAQPSPQVKEPSADVVSIPSYQTMTWLWQCQNSPSPVPKPKSETDVIVSGKGPFEFNEESLRGTKVTFSGKICPPDAQPRDIVFVIDTSASMDNSDPLVGASCGRLKSVEAVISSIPNGLGRFGVVTFNSNLGVSSAKLFESSQTLFAAVAPGQAIADVICDATGVTNYDSGLTPASQILAMGRANATKEIYFISDGKPNQGDGIALSTSLKSTGVNVSGRNIPVTIGTIMLVTQADDAALRALASTDSQGKILHVFVAQAQDLAKALTDLAANKIVSASLKYRLIGDKDFTILNVMDHLKGLEFSLPPMNFPIKNGVPGLEVIYEYMDKLGQKFSTTGEIILKVTAGTGP